MFKHFPESRRQVAELAFLGLLNTKAQAWSATVYLQPSKNACVFSEANKQINKQARHTLKAVSFLALEVFTIS